MKFKTGDRIVALDTYPPKEFRGIEGTLTLGGTEYGNPVTNLSFVPDGWGRDFFETNIYDLEEYFEHAEVVKSPLWKALE